MNNNYINEKNTPHKITLFNDNDIEQYHNKTYQENEIIIKIKENKNLFENNNKTKNVEKTENDNIKETNKDEDNENEKLIKTLNDINKKLNDQNNKNLGLEQIYEKYNKIDNDKVIIKEKNSKFKNYFFFFLLWLFL